MSSGRFDGEIVLKNGCDNESTMMGIVPFISTPAARNPVLRSRT
jgi:hypothetical protein